MNSVGVLSAGGLGPGAGALDHRRPARRRRHRLRRRPVPRRGSSTPAYRATRTDRDPRHGVRRAHARASSCAPPATGCSRRCTSGWSRTAGCCARCRGWEGADWFAGPGVDARGRADLGPRAVVRAVGGRAPRRPRGRRADGHVVHGEVRGARAPTPARCSTGSRPARQRRADGWITYTQWLDDDGRIEADLTVTKLAADDFLVVASDTAHGHALGLLARAASGTPTCRSSPTSPPTSRQLNRPGPARRATLLADAAPTPTCRPRPSAVPRRPRDRAWPGCAVLCARITYLGELGYELYVAGRPRARGCTTRCGRGAAHGIRPVGLKALASLRMEKAYRDFGHDIDNTDCPLEVGLGFAVALDKPGGFRGREAALAAQGAAARRRRQRLVQVAARATPSRCCSTPSRCCRDGVVVGYVRAASYGWTLGARRRAGVRRRRRAGHRRLAGRRAPGRSTSPARATPPRCRCGRCTTRPAPG